MWLWGYHIKPLSFFNLFKILNSHYDHNKYFERLIWTFQFSGKKDRKDWGQTEHIKRRRRLLFWASTTPQLQTFLKNFLLWDKTFTFLTTAEYRDWDKREDSSVKIVTPTLAVLPCGFCDTFAFLFPFFYCFLN